MFCKYCGNELEDEAKFCSKCGNEVLRKAADEAPANVASESTPAVEAAENTSFKAAVRSTDRKQRGKFTMVLLVVLALSLLTGTAFALHYVYTTYVAPAPEVVEEPETNPEAEAATAAYQEIIEEYQNAIAAAEQAEEQGEDWAYSYTEDEYPHVNAEFPQGRLLSGESSPAYAYKDLNEDGIPELIIKDDYTVYSIWSYKDGETILVADHQLRSESMTICEDNVVIWYAGSGVNIYSYSAVTLNTELTGISLYDADSDMDSDANSNWINLEWISSDRIEDHGSIATSNDTNTVYYQKGTGDYNNIDDSGTCSVDQFASMRDELYAKYPEDTSIEWIAF